MRLERAFPSLSFTNLTGLYEAPDGTGRLFALEQRGRIQVFENRNEVSQKSVWLDITNRVNMGGEEEGLLGLAFAPDFALSGQFYVNYTATNPRRTVISRFTASPSQSGLPNPATELKVLEVGQPFANHNGGYLLFGPDGFLYIGLGDGGGSGGDPMGNGQSLNTLLSKMLRIDVSGTSQGRNYRVPPDNPFVGQGGGVREEIWALGLRNPWRYAFDSETNDLWVADVGQDALEEIDVVQKGKNYGWSVLEGSKCFRVANCNTTGLTLPIFEYDHSAGACSITGAFVYRGNQLPALQGAYVYGDFCNGKVWALRYDGKRVTEQKELLDSNIAISSFAQDSRGAIYVLAYSSSGGIFRLVP